MKWFEGIARCVTVTESKVFNRVMACGKKLLHILVIFDFMKRYLLPFDRRSKQSLKGWEESLAMQRAFLLHLSF